MSQLDKMLQFDKMYHPVEERTNMSNVKKTRKMARTRKHRDPEYEVRDKLFLEQCDSCARVKQCMYAHDKLGPETLCTVLILYGTYNCESCLRYKKYGGCIFQCIFYRPKSEPVDNL